VSNKIILAIDFNNVLFGSYYSEKVLNSNGINTNAINVFFYKLKKLKESFNPSYIVIANDLGRSKTFRRSLYKPYKANRKGADEDIINQLKYTSQILSLMGYPFINNELYEADDILGMISKFALDNNMDTILVSTDKDLYQLLNDNTFILSPKSNELIDANWLYGKYKLTPQQWIEMKILQGDAGDNIPGVKGIGEITSIRLLQQFNTIENIYKHIDQIKWNIKENLIEFKDMIPLVKTLITIVIDYNIINLNEDMLMMKEKYPTELFEVLNNLELDSLNNIMRYSLLVDKYHIQPDAA
jgi:DNA polymerase-1